MKFETPFRRKKLFQKSRTYYEIPDNMLEVGTCDFDDQPSQIIIKGTGMCFKHLMEAKF